MHSPLQSRRNLGCKRGNSPQSPQPPQILEEYTLTALYHWHLLESSKPRPFKYLHCPPPLGLSDLLTALHILVIFKHLQGQSVLYCSTIAQKKDARLRLGIGIGILLTYLRLANGTVISKIYRYFQKKIVSLFICFCTFVLRVRLELNPILLKHTYYFRIK